VSYQGVVNSLDKKLYVHIAHKLNPDLCGYLHLLDDVMARAMGGDANSRETVCYAFKQWANKRGAKLTSVGWEDIDLTPMPMAVKH